MWPWLWFCDEDDHWIVGMLRLIVGLLVACLVWTAVYGTVIPR